MPNKKTLRIGVTGGIGSGKTLACWYFEKLGFYVIYADSIAKSFYKTNKDLKKKLIKEFGTGILDNTGEISGPNSRKVFFSSVRRIKRLGEIVHPFVRKEIELLIQRSEKKTVLIETAIMFESGYYKTVDFVLLIYSTRNIRVQRIMKRDKITRHDILKLMKFQMDEKEKMKHADFIIRNNSTPSELQKKVKSFSEILSVL